MTMSLRMMAVRATFCFFPAWMSCVYFAFRSGLKRAATRVWHVQRLPDPRSATLYPCGALPLS